MIWSKEAEKGFMNKERVKFMYLNRNELCFPDNEETG